MLDEKEQYVVNARYPTEVRIKSFTEIGDELGYTKQRMQQIEKEALEKLAAMENRTK